MKPNDLSGIQVLKRDGSVVGFDQTKIITAVSKAYIDVHKADGSAMRDFAHSITERVVAAVLRDPSRVSVSIEDIQDRVELEIMRAGDHKLSRGYVLFREERARLRAERTVAEPPVIRVKLWTGDLEPLDPRALQARIETAAQSLGEVDARAVTERAMAELFDGCSSRQVDQALLMAARSMMERDPAYDRLAARLVLQDLYREVGGTQVESDKDRARLYSDVFEAQLHHAVDCKLVADELSWRFDLAQLREAIQPSRDDQFRLLGIQTLADRYLLRFGSRRVELPQTFFMRVAMGLALNEDQPTDRAIEFYDALSSFRLMCSTPTLFNSGTLHPQLSSCYLTTVADDLRSIYGSITHNALLQKFAGGLGNDWTRVRAMGARIHGTNGRSQGVVPFLKVVNDTAVAVNQGGKRPGAVCSYLETWHLDIEEFLQLRKNTGDDRRRTHDMDTAHWIPDLFMKRVEQGADWTLFSPDEVPDLHDLCGRAFEEAYERYEAMAENGEIWMCRKVPAVELWRKMLTMLFETGHPWLTFKDACNLRSPQQHCGVIHSSNLCTEITLNTSDTEIAVCNLASVNLAAHIAPGAAAPWLDLPALRKTVRTAIRMLDNVIDRNLYAVDKARRSNMRHRPIGLGLMGFQDLLYAANVSFADPLSVEVADQTAEALCYFAYEASSDLAVERGPYPSYTGSLWSRGVLPIDTVATLGAQRGIPVDVRMTMTLDWAALREKIIAQGMRNSNCVAIAPTATIANIIGVTPSIEPTYENLYVKSNMSGEFTVLNESLVAALKERGLWDDMMRHDLKFFDGSVSRIDRVPADLKALYATAFEIDPLRLVEAAARRQKWIDQSQSLNLYIARATGPQLDKLYRTAWRSGLKTTYYLRTLAATHVEKSTVAHGALNAVGNAPAEGAVCTLKPGDSGYEGCEACQ